jgi:hypothetical protein
MTAPQKGDYIKVQGNKQYLPVPQRVQWFRGDHPDWTIATSVVELQWTEGYAVMRAEVLDDTGRLISSGIKTETRKGFGDFVEKAETGAVGRALARAGYGTEDALDLDGDRFADAPIEQPERGERTPPAGRRAAASSATTPAPAQYRRQELAELLHEKGLGQADALRYAAIVGIPDTERPMTDESMDKLIDAIRGHGVQEAPIETAGAPAVESSEPEDAPSSSGPPPKPATPEYGALTPVEKAKARAYWANPPEEPSLAEQLTVGAA